MGSVIHGNDGTTPFLGPEKTHSANATIERLTVNYHGLYDSLVAAEPATGSQIAGLPANLYVADVQTRREEGGFGTTTVTLDSVSWSTAPLSPTILKTTLEIDMAQVEKPIATHPSLASYADAARDLDMWRNETRRDLRTAFKYLPTPDSADSAAVTLAGIPATIAAKILMGIESYLIFAPVVNRITVSDSRPTGQSCGKIETPPLAVGITGFTYLKTADRVVQNADKSWTRTESWTGSNPGWDTDLYETAGA